MKHKYLSVLKIVLIVLIVEAALSGMYYLFVYDANNIRVATVKKNKWSVTRKFEIEDTPDAMSIEGKFFGLTSKILRNETQVGVISRELTLARDSFALEADEKDIAFLTALVVAFDNLQDKRQKDND